MISDRLAAAVRCPDCGGVFTAEPARLHCPCCGREARRGGDFLDLRPRQAFAEVTKYTDEALHADARHESVSPPLLGAGVRNRMLRDFLQLGPGDRVVDLGCGSGRMLAWNRVKDAWTVGVDVAPFFAGEARINDDLVLADLRRLPFEDGAFTKAWSLDVLEHLSPEALDGMLTEAGRILAPNGALFVYTHVRKNSWIAGGLGAINAVARLLERWGFIDMTQERLRKSDHLNPLADHAHLERVVAAAGFRISRIRYYTPLVGGLIENILVRVVEHGLVRRADRSYGRTLEAPAATPPAPADGVAMPIPASVAASSARDVRTAAKQRLARGGPLLVALNALTWLMQLDVWLFGRVRSGPFFALLVKESGPRPS